MISYKAKEKALLALIKCIRAVPVIDRYAYIFSQFYVDSYRHFTYDFRTNGEFALLDCVAKMQSDETLVFFDVGANVGEWSQYFCNVLDNYEGHLFEMVEETFEILKRNFSDNDNLTFINKAITNKTGLVDYKLFPGHSTVNSLVVSSEYFNQWSSEMATTSAMTGDEYCKQNDIKRINLLKLDVEGAEYSALEGFKECLEEKRIDIVQFEYTYRTADARMLMRDFFMLFESYGYSVGRLTPFGVKFKEFEYSDNDFKSGPNFVTCLPEFVDKLSGF